MKTARELFKKLGFIQMDDGSYLNPTTNLDIKADFDCNRIYIGRKFNFLFLDPNTIKALYKLCEELGWFED